MKQSTISKVIKDAHSLLSNEQPVPSASTIKAVMSERRCICLTDDATGQPLAGYHNMPDCPFSINSEAEILRQAAVIRGRRGGQSTSEAKKKAVKKSLAKARKLRWLKKRPEASDANN